MSCSMIHIGLIICQLLFIGRLPTAGATVARQANSRLIQWPAGCDEYQVTKNVRPLADIFRRQSNINLSTCRSLCTNLTHCGGFVSGSCWLFNINDQIITDHLNKKHWYWKFPLSTSSWYSKTCPYDTGASDLECDSYSDKVYYNQYIADRWRITYTSVVVPHLQASECHAWCTLYTGCRSVGYSQHGESYAGCHLYNTTIQDLLEAGFDGDVLGPAGTNANYTTYDRYCTSPHPSPLTSPHLTSPPPHLTTHGLTASDIPSGDAGLLHGETIALPLGVLAAALITFIVDV